MKSDSLFQESPAHLSHRLSCLTRNQQAVLDVLHEQPNAVSAQAVYRVLREQQVIGLATIYRALEALKLRGLIKSRVGANGESFYSPVVLDQRVLTCLQCGQSFPLDHCPVQELEDHLHSPIPFKIYYHTLEFFGLCEPCTHLL